MLRAMRRTPLVVLSMLVLSLPACGDADADGEGGGGPALDCAVAIGDATSVEIGEGAHTRLTLTVGADVTSVAIGEAPDGLRASVVDGELVLESAYGEAGPFTLTLDATCGDKSEPATIDVTVRAIDFAPLADWDAGDGPPGREYGAMWIDSGDPDRLLVFGGFHYEPEQFTPAADLWEWNLADGGWTELEATNAPLLPGGRMVEVPGERAALYYGGLEVTEDGGSATPYSLVRFDYAPGALTFTEVETSTKPAGDYLPAIVYDAPRDRYVSACGVSDVYGYHCQIFTFDPKTGEWKGVVPAAGDRPTGRNGFFWVHDVDNERLVLFSGDGGSGGWACDCAQDTWALELAEDPPRWVKLAGEQTPPIGRRNGAYAHDTAGHRMFVWGGTPDGMDSFPGVYVFDLDRGEEGWAKVDTAFTPPERTSAMGVFDAARNRLVLGFGNDGAVYSDLWALNL